MEARILGWINGTGAESLDQVLPELHAVQFSWNAPYRAFCQALGVGERITHWREIPPLPQEAFKHADLRAFPPEQTIGTFHTSGTTGEGCGRHHFRTLAIYEASILAGWHHAELPKAPYLVLAPHPDEAPHSSLSHMLATLAPKENFIAWGGNIDLSRLCDLATPVCLLGTALGFLRLFEVLSPKELKLPEGSSAMETGGYKGSGREISRPELYAMFEDKLGIPGDQIINEYGMTELSSQFYARGPQGLHQGPPWAKAVIADPTTLQEVPDGQPGIVLIYDAANTGSVCAIRTRDLAVRRGNAFELLGRDPSALPRGCSRAADEFFAPRAT